MAPKKKRASGYGRENYSREELSILGRKKRIEEDPEFDDWMTKQSKGKGNYDDDIWDDPSLYDESWTEEDF